ncbi:MAG: ABC transporter permease subunit [Oscillospiraceae bacterium]|nr:ABC transporter permease subunit [Oscillospiraceae bacterium]
MKAVFKRELRSYFTSGIGLAYCSLFIFLANLSYQTTYVEQFSSNFVGIFGVILGNMSFLIPILTMRIWSEEKKQKTDQLLLTAPVTPMQLVMGKFMAAMTVYFISIILTFAYPIITYTYGVVEWRLIIGNYIAITCVAAAYIAICQFMSCLTESQIISAILSLATLLCFSMFHDIVGADIELLYKVASFISIELRYMNFLNGIFALSDIVYFISLAAFFLFINSRMIDKRRWS